MLCGHVSEFVCMDSDEDMSWLTQRSPDDKPYFDLLSESEDEITIDEGNVGSNGACPDTYSNVSIEDFGFSNPVTSTQIYDGVFAEDISSDEELEKL